MDSNKLPLEPRHHGVSLGASKTISEPMVHSAQTVHLYCTDSKTVSKRTEMRFHMTHSPRSSIGCVQDDLLSRWYIQLQLRTYLASRLAQSPNRLKQDSTWASSPRSIVGCIQNNFWADGTFDKNHAPFLRQYYHYLQTDSNKLPLEPHHLGVSSGTSKMNSEPMVHSVQTFHLYCSGSNTVSKRTETRFHVTHSPRSSIGCVLENFWADGTFDTNHAPILRQD
jgi:hypothetical protein